MFDQTRRGLIGGLATLLLAAPAVIRIPGILMPIKPQLVTEPGISIHDLISLADEEIFWSAWPEVNKEAYFREKYGWSRVA